MGASPDLPSGNAVKSAVVPQMRARPRRPNWGFRDAVLGVIRAKSPGVAAIPGVGVAADERRDLIARHQVLPCRSRTEHDGS
jgi:hypothetical protein